jgi:predicted dithiol-disulfide oxidoreductase (DUF899 family)
MGESLHTTRFPGESEEYRRAREELLRAEIELRRGIEAVAAQRRALPPGGEVPVDYAFEESAEDADAASEVRLSELFAEGRDTLFLYSFMFLPGPGGKPLEVACPACTSIIDALDGEAPHITRQINLAVCAKVPIGQFRAHARDRGWRHARLLSSAASSFNGDYNAESPEGAQRPIAHVFVRRNGTIRHSWSSELAYAPSEPGQHPRHVDFMWPAWNVFDTTPEGRGNWDPQLTYI